MAPLVADPHGATDLLVAPATPPGTGALAILRLSGPRGTALAAARRLAPAVPANAAPRHAYRSLLLDAEGGALDEGLVLFFPAPRSAPGEEVVELHCHGSRGVVRALLEAAVRAGARPARPGEFTRRALANGRLDLARAEAVAGLSAAESRGEARRALGLYEGALSNAVGALRERLLDLLADLEATLDFCEEVPPVPREELRARCAAAEAELARLADAPLVRAGGDAPAIAILGRPNAGKSTLFNALLGEDRAIVTEHPGTTRDLLSEEVEIAGERVRVLDTAGLRREPEPVERIGIERAQAAAREAALVLYLVDGSVGLTREDRDALAALAAPPEIVATKGDLPRGGDVPEGALSLSARNGEGLDTLRGRISARLGLRPAEGGIAIAARHREALRRARNEMREAAALLDRGEELSASALRRTLGAIGEITGETATGELLDRIFATFCIGK